MGPISDQAINLQPELACSPCLSLGFEYGCKNGGCMELIKTNEVLAAVQDQLNQKQENKKTRKQENKKTRKPVTNN